MRDVGHINRHRARGTMRIGKGFENAAIKCEVTTMSYLLNGYVDADPPVIQLSPEEEADLAEADAEIERGGLASDEEVAAVFAKFRL